MFLHLGGCVVVPLEEVVTIVQIGREASSPDTAAFLKAAEKEGLVMNIAPDQASSATVTTKGVYLSSISAATLSKRARDLAPLRGGPLGATGS
ncbi:MAG: DUF370 domain-containing protein [Firmicutes bacterium]|nr:DUF370 domain-containing protein [Bacillota bacterium]